MEWSKRAVFAAFRAHLRGALDDLNRARDAAQAGTRVDGSHRPENRGERAAVTSQGYLTAGLTARGAELQGHLDALGILDPGPRDQGAPGALVKLEDESGSGVWYALLPGGQAARLVVDGQALTVLSPGSPLGVALRGAREGDVVEGPRGQELEVVALF